jgi:hypothetical protein
MSNMLRGARRRRGWWLGTELMLVDESDFVHHKCGHDVFWELPPGQPGNELREVAQHNCPCCGAYWGDPAEWAKRNGRPCPEWPDHVIYKGLGIAHCHDATQDCELVDMAHRAALASGGHR